LSHEEGGVVEVTTFNDQLTGGDNFSLPLSSTESV